HVLRFLNKRVPHDYGTVPLPLFWGLVLVWIFPWSSFLVRGLADVPRRLKDLGTRAQANLLLAIWAGVILLFFSFSTRQEYYVLPALPALALLIGGALAHESPRTNQRPSAVLLAIGTAAFVFSLLTVLWTWTISAPADVAAMLTKNPDKYALSF